MLSQAQVSTPPRCGRNDKKKSQFQKLFLIFAVCIKHINNAKTYRSIVAFSRFPASFKGYRYGEPQSGRLVPLRHHGRSVRAEYLVRHPAGASH